MNLYMVQGDSYDISFPILAEDAHKAAEFYVQDVIEWQSDPDLEEVREIIVAFVTQIVAPEGGRGLMKDVGSTSFMMESFPSWGEHLARLAQRGTKIISVDDE